MLRVFNAEPYLRVQLCLQQMFKDGSKQLINSMRFIERWERTSKLILEIL